MTYVTGARHLLGQPEQRTLMSPRCRRSASMVHGASARSRIALADIEVRASANRLVNFRQARVPCFTLASNIRAWTINNPVRTSGDGTIRETPLNVTRGRLLHGNVPAADDFSPKRHGVDAAPQQRGAG